LEGVARASRLRLLDEARPQIGESGVYAGRAGWHHDDRSPDPRLPHERDGVSYERLASPPVEDLLPGRSHALALAGSEDHGPGLALGGAAPGSPRGDGPRHAWSPAAARDRRGG